jgi:uncharacterized protein YdeI (YjbR/CyaY-like superfamily)
MKPKYFRTADDFRCWLERHHADADELLVGFYKKDSGTASITWPESVDEALCFGWIDGVRRRLDERRYTIRFTPRRPRSNWSAINIARVGALVEQGRMQPAGLAAFTARREGGTGAYSYEQRPADLVEPYAALLKKNARAWRFFSGQPPSYRRVVTWWIVSAKREETRLRRLEKLIAWSAQGQRIPETLPAQKARPVRAAGPGVPVAARTQTG